MAAQIAAVLIFLVMFLLIIMDKIERHIITSVCAVCASYIDSCIWNLYAQPLSNY